MKTNHQNHMTGFTLIELAIVLVIMGLIVGGVFGGRELYEVSRIKGVIGDIQQYKVHTNEFDMVYNGLPGDISDATSYWSSGTANGNGNGNIGDGTVGDDTEPYYAWDQLTLAKMIPGTYSGAGTSAVVNANCPESSYFSGGGYSLSYFVSPGSYQDAMGYNFPGNYIIFGRGDGSDNFLSDAVITPDRAYYIDSKMDDGTADYGEILSITGGNATGNCTSGSGQNIDYELANSGIACIVLVNISN